jgi:hypothetical protein
MTDWEQSRSQQQPPQQYGPPPGGWSQQPPPYGYPPAPPPRKRPWVARHKILTALLSVIGLFVVIGIAAGAAGSGGSSTSGSTGSTGSVAQPSSAAPTAQHAAGIGDKVRDGKFEFVITKVTHRKTAGDPQFGGETAQGEFTVLHVKITNISDVAQTLDDSAQYVYDQHGRKYDANSSADFDLNNGDSVFLQDINPGNTVRGVIAFDMPIGAREARAELHDSLFSDGVMVRLR